MTPTCELGEHWVSAKSTEEHSASTLGLPNIPGGRSKAMFFGISGAPAFAKVNLVVRSGWPPASWLDDEVSNSEIERLAASAGAASTPRAVSAAISAMANFGLAIA